MSALAGRPDDVEALLGAATALCEARLDLARAADLARRAILLAPGAVEGHLCLAKVFLAGSRHASARGAIEAALLLDPGSAAARELLRGLPPG